MQFLTSLILAAGYSFTVDGRQAVLPATELSDTRAVVTVDGVPLLLDAPRQWDFVVERDAKYQPTVIRERGRIVGLLVSARERGSRQPTLSRKEMAALHGIVLDRSAASPALRQLTPAKVCVTVTDEHLSEGASAIEPGPLPPGLACFIERLRGPLPDLGSTRFFESDTYETFDLTALEGAKQLEALRVRSQTLLGLPSLNRLPALERLALFDGAFTRLGGSFERLEELELWGQGLAQLDTLSAPRLRTLQVESDELVSLPPKLPALTAAAVVSPRAGPSIDALAKAHPGALVGSGWLGRLRFATRGADRVLVRDGGLCHRHAEERVLHEGRGRASVDELLALITLDEAKSHGICMCCGGPTLELYRGETLLVAMSVQHGHALRWNWRADARLADGKLAQALSSWGISEPLKEWTKTETSRLEQQRRFDRYVAFLPKPLLAGLDPDEAFPADFVDRLADQLPVGEQLVLVHLRLVGSLPTAWTHAPRYVVRESRFGVDEASFGLLKRTAPETLAGIAVRADPDLDAGLVRLLFAGEGTDLLEAPALGKHVPRLALFAMNRPAERDRQGTLRVLAASGSEAATEALRQILAAELKPATTDLGDDPTYSSARERAALFLARRRDTSSFSAIRRVCASARGDDCGTALTLIGP